MALDTRHEFETPHILRLPDVEARVGLSRSQLYLLMGEGKFPKSISLSARAVGWVNHEVDAWIAQRITQSRQQAA